MPVYALSSEELRGILDKTIETFLNYRDKRGFGEPEARQAAVTESVSTLPSGTVRPRSEGDQEKPAAPLGMEIYIVEFRQHVATGIEEGSRFSYSSVNAYIASSMEEAVSWCKRNTDYEEHDSNRVWDFAIRKREVNSDLKGGGLMLVLDWNGEVSGYKV